MSNKINNKNAYMGVLFFTNVQKVLGYFLSHPFVNLYDREVASLTKISAAGTNFALRDLAKFGLLKREQKGRMVFYSLDNDSAFIRQLKIVQTIALLMTLVDNIKKYSLKIILFGSASKGADHEESDIDLFILTRDKTVIEKYVHKFSSEREIKPLIYSITEWAKISSENNVFAKQVEDGIVLWEANES